MKADSVLFWLIALFAAGLVLIGAWAVVEPMGSARGFGVPVSGMDTFAYLWAAGTRDIVLGLLVMAFLRLRVSRRVLAVSMAVTALIPIGDVLNVYVNVGTVNAPALMLHGCSAVFMCVLAFFLARERRNEPLTPRG